ncbi:diguanylate cyclase [Desulfonatronospira sp.]|uniref:diguanylate cyclase domain-containing protein n=1 Tax=Desulfonatronospira sp. TaxID=1962951 RepID=UPI0025C526BF|nr:diguanylate cyclase [Desulfonatronospira sp.]
MKPSLDKSDLILFESVLRDSLQAVISFSAYSLYFPQDIPSIMYQDQEIVPAVEKDRILLPLVHDGRFLGIFMARGTDRDRMHALSSNLPGIISLCLDKILLQKQCITDSITGLYNQEKFQQILEKAVEDIQASLTLGPAASMDSGLDRYSATFCVMLINPDRFKRINETFGYTFGNQVLSELAEHIRKELPEQAVSARLCNDTLAVFWPQAPAARCRELAGNLRSRISSLVFEFPVSGEKISLSAGIGWSLFPQDVKGPQFQRSSFELARLVCRKAEEALKVSKENHGSKAFAFSQILQHGGVILEVLPLNRLVINLGKNMDAIEGQKFLVWSQKFNGQSQSIKKAGHYTSGTYPAIHKGEIAIQEVQEEVSIAEILYLNDPAWKIEPGDKLSLLAEKESLLEKQDILPRDIQPRDLFTGLYSYRDFLSLWTRARIQDESFCMAMLKLEYPGRDTQSKGIDGENLVQEIIRLVDRIFDPQPLSGRYSSTCMVFYFSGQNSSSLKEPWLNLLEEIKSSLHIQASLALADFPCLSYSKTDTLENCRKALEHARLTTPPRMACFDSLTLTVSADSLFSQGDTFAALEEYKQALAADENNLLARNSLAICYARLGRLELAGQHFKEITARDSENLMAWYNLGCVCLKQGDSQEAAGLFERCLEIDSSHAYSLLRLGQLAENSEEFEKAARCYQDAGQTRDGAGLAPRHLARLAWKQDQKEQSREFLHQALLQDPRDAFSLNLMARIYLDSGDDPEIAESLARQSVALRPDVSEFWLDLADILRAGNKSGQEAQARARASG